MKATIWIVIAGYTGCHCSGDGTPVSCHFNEEDALKSLQDIELTSESCFREIWKFEEGQVYDYKTRIITTCEWGKPYDECDEVESTPT